MLRRSTILLGLMLTGSLAAAVLVSEDNSLSSEVVAPSSDHRYSDGVKSRGPTLIPAVLHLDKLVRAEASEPESDPFISKSWYVPAPPPPPPPPVLKEVIQESQSPTAPPLPFGYLGRMLEEDGHVVIYLTQGGHVYSVSQGDTINGSYRLDEVSSSRLALIYLPLDIRQTLTIGNTP